MDLPKRKQNRLVEYDYSTPNAYFITVCTKNRKNLFWMEVGAIIDRPNNVPLTNLGMIARQSIEDIPNYYSAVSVDHFVIMPNPDGIHDSFLFVTEKLEKTVVSGTKIV